MKKDYFYFKLLIVLTISVATILYLRKFNDYLQPYIETSVLNILTPVIVFFLLMKLFGFGKLQYVNSKKFIQLFIQMLYEFRYGFMALLIFVLAYNSIGKEASFANVLVENYEHTTKEQIITVYNINHNDHTLYDQSNKIFYYYNQDNQIEPNKTYKITYLKSSKIITNIQGPLNTNNFEREDTVQVTDIKYKDGAATLTWKPFFYKGLEVRKYRIEGYVKEGGTLLRSGSQIVVDKRQTSATVKNLKKNGEYQFMIEPYINEEFNEDFKGTTKFIYAN